MISVFSLWGLISVLLNQAKSGLVSSWRGICEEPRDCCKQRWCPSGPVLNCLLSCGSSRGLSAVGNTTFPMSYMTNNLLVITELITPFFTNANLIVISKIQHMQLESNFLQCQLGILIFILDCVNDCHLTYGF